MSDSDNLLTMNHIFASVMDESKFSPGSLQKDFSGDLSFEDLIMSAVSRTQKWLMLDQFVKLIEMRVKCKYKSTAKALRKEGNSYYMEWSLEMALNKFNESIKYSPHPPINDVSNENKNSLYKNLSLSYANRAAVFFEMGLYDEACTDIRRAASHGYSQEKHYLSVSRYCKSLIYIHLKQNPQSSITSSVFDTVFEKTETDLECTLDDEQRKLIREHKFDVEKSANKKSGIPKYFEAPKPVLEGQHPHIPGLSNKVEFAARINRGRYLIAGEDIYPGTLLAIDPGFTAATSYNKLVGEYCSACSKPCKFIFVPCHQCTSAVFCNELCRDRAFKSYHRHECSVLPLLGLLGLNNIPDLTLRIIVSLGYSKLHDYVKIFDREEEAKKPSIAKCGFSSEGIYDSKSYRTVYYLSHHKEKRDAKDLFENSVTAVVMTFILKKYTTFFGEESLSSVLSVNDVHFNEREMFIAKLILRHLMSITVNVFLNFSYEKSSESFEKKIIGSKVQCLFSLFGHSCNPNAFSADPHTLRSMAIIPKGTEICICYRYNYIEFCKQDRQADLTKFYYFTCDCIACVEDWQNNDGNYEIAISDIRVKCMFGCKNGTLNKLTQRCTKCSKGLKRDKSLYSETYLKHINKIIYGSSSENLKSIQRDMALTRENMFTELDTQIKFVSIFDDNGKFANSLKLLREVAYNVSKGIYLFDTYGDCPNNYLLYAMRHILKKFYGFSSNRVVFQ